MRAAMSPIGPRPSTLTEPPSGFGVSGRLPGGGQDVRQVDVAGVRRSRGHFRIDNCDLHHITK